MQFTTTTTLPMGQLLLQQGFIDKKNAASSLIQQKNSATTANQSKPKRKQVKNACVHCQKACKKCDDGRPCQRCIKYNLADTCRDSVRKERQKGVKRGPYKRSNRQREPKLIRSVQAASSYPLDVIATPSTNNNTRTVMSPMSVLPNSNNSGQVTPVAAAAASPASTITELSHLMVADNILYGSLPTSVSPSLALCDNSNNNPLYINSSSVQSYPHEEQRVAAKKSFLYQFIQPEESSNDVFIYQTLAEMDLARSDMARHLPSYNPWAPYPLADNNATTNNLSCVYP